MRNLCFLKGRKQGGSCAWPHKHSLLLCMLTVMGLLFFCVGILTNAGDLARWPETGLEVLYSGKLVLDDSNRSEGYVIARVAEPTSKRLKLRVVYNGKNLDYDLDGSGESMVVPLQMGSGSYQMLLYENTSGKKYAEVGALEIYAQLSREDAAFLYPNQYVDYTLLSAAVEEADSMLEGKNDREAYETVCDFMSSRFVYDFIKALTVKPGMLPDIDGSFDKRMGVCQDLSAILCCMLRTRGIPARLIIGYADNNYHAWTISEVDGQECFFDPTAQLNAISQVHEYSVERYY